MSAPETGPVAAPVTGASFGDMASAWLRGRAPRPALVSAVLVFTLSSVRAYGKARSGIDNAVVVRAARALLSGGSPYADKRFLYPPGAVFAALPQTLLSEKVLFYAVPVVTGALVAMGGVLALRIFGVRADSRLAVALALGTALFLPFQSLVFLGNWTAASVVAFPAALLLARDGRWCAAGAVVGAAVALKPMLVPLLLLFLLARQWRALAWALGLPAVISLSAALALPGPGLFFTRTLPFLLHGQDAYARPYDASWPAVLPRLGVPHPLAFALAAAAATAVLYFAWLRWRRGGDPGLRLVECAALLMLAAFVVSRPSFLNYALVVVPSLVTSVVVRGAAVRSVWFWVPLVPQLGGVPWPGVDSAQRHAFRDVVMFGGLAAVLGLAAWRGRGPDGGVVTESSYGYSLCSEVEASSEAEVRPDPEAR
ncbi:glycosyltransferase family 87 protein [Streptomyces sp. NPDC001678]|uniref:glycosyltransferase family 87 protein n=1 Tax=Streptomyces sp. NPDC001678 TaxID=3364599 RepID=UPI003677CEFE